MKLKFLRVAVPLAAAAFMVPTGVAADCVLGNYRLAVGWFDEGDRELSGSASFGDGQTVIGGNATLALNDKWTGGAGLGYCSSGGSSALSFGGRATVEAYVSEQGWTLEVGLALVINSFDGNRTTTAPLAVYVLYPVNDQVAVFGGPSFQWQRFSNDVFSASNDNLGLQGGLQYSVNSDWTLAGGLDLQFYTGTTQTSLNVGANYAIQE